MKRVFIKTMLLLIFTIFSVGCAHEKVFTKMDYSKNTLDECIAELDKRIAMEPPADKEIKYSAHQRESVFYGETFRTDIEIKVLSPVSDKTRALLTSNLAKEYAFMEFYEYKDEKPSKIKININPKVNVGMFNPLLEGEKDYSIDLEISFIKVKDVAQAFEVALDRRYKDIISCVIEKADNKKDLSRMVVPLFQYIDLYEMNDGYDLFYELLSRDPEFNEPFPCLDYDGRRPNNYCLPLIKCIGKNFCWSFFVETILSKGIDINAKDSQGRNAMLLMIEKAAKLEEKQKNFKETWDLLIKNGFKPEKLFFPENEDIDNFVNIWFTTQLVGLNETSLFDQAQASTNLVFRFLWLRSFHKPVVIRIEKNETNKLKIVAKMATGAGGYDPGEVEKEISRELTDEEMKEFYLKFNQSDFWNTLKEKDNGMRMLDGAEWIFEGVENGKYHVVVRTSLAEKTNPYKEMGRFLLKLTGLYFKSIY